MRETHVDPVLIAHIARDQMGRVFRHLHRHR
jgi:hypothetical protein